MIWETWDFRRNLSDKWMGTGGTIGFRLRLTQRVCANA